MAKWTAPVLEELSIPGGTFGSVDDSNGSNGVGPDTIGTAADPGTTAS